MRSQSNPFNFALGVLVAIVLTGNAGAVGPVPFGSIQLTDLTPGSVPFIGTGDLVTQDNASFFWDDTNDRLYIGTAGTASVGGDIRVEKSAAATSVAIGARNTATTGTSIIQAVNDLGEVALLRANGSATANTDLLTIPRSSLSITTATGGQILGTIGAAPLIFITGGSAVANERARFTSDGALNFLGIPTASAPAVSAADRGSTYYDSTLDVFMCSKSGGAYADCAGGAASLPATDTTSIVEGSADATKEIRFEVDGLTTGTVRVLTPPDADVVLAGSAVALTSGRIPVVTTSGLLTNTANFTWDNTNFRLRAQNLTSAADATTTMVQLSGTLPTTPSANVPAMDLAFTSAGSASFNQFGLQLNLLAGYTGSSSTRAFSMNNQAVGTGNTLGLNGGAGALGNLGASLAATGAATGVLVGAQGVTTAGTGASIGLYGQAGGAAAGTRIGVLGNASDSSEGTDLKNVAGLFTLNATLPTANVSVALLAQSDGTEDIFRGYDGTTLMFRAEDSGEFTSAGTATLGWTVVAAANQACTTTCTSACVVGIDTSAASALLLCSDATADSCLCAGAS